MPTDSTVHISRIDSERLRVPIIGTTPLIVNNFSQKAKQQMLDAQQGRKSPKQAREPEAEYDAAFYRMSDGAAGFPVTGFKQATVSAARFYGKNVTMASLRQCLFFHGVISTRDAQQLVEIIGEAKMREDVVRLARGGSADLRYRPEFREWSATLVVTYVKSLLTRDSLLSLLDAGGMGVGVGEWRPEKGGEFGTFAIDVDKGIEVIDDA